MEHRAIMTKDIERYVATRYSPYQSLSFGFTIHIGSMAQPTNKQIRHTSEFINPK